MSVFHIWTSWSFRDVCRGSGSEKGTCEPHLQRGCSSSVPAMTISMNTTMALLSKLQCRNPSRRKKGLARQARSWCNWLRLLSGCSFGELVGLLMPSLTMGVTIFWRPRSGTVKPSGEHVFVKIKTLPLYASFIGKHYESPEG